MKQRIIFLFFLILVIGLSGGCKSSKEKVYYEILENYEKLSDNIIQLLENNKITDDVKLYVTHVDGVYEYLLYYAHNKGENLYQMISIKPYMQKDILKLEIDVSDAMDEGNVNDELYTYMILKEEPKQIQVSINGENIECSSVEKVDSILK